MKYYTKSSQKDTPHSLEIVPVRVVIRFRQPSRIRRNNALNATTLPPTIPSTRVLIALICGMCGGQAVLLCTFHNSRLERYVRMRAGSLPSLPFALLDDLVLAMMWKRNRWCRFKCRRWYGRRVYPLFIVEVR